MIKLNTRCKYCVHSEVCKNINKPKYFADHLSEVNYGDGPNDDYDFGTMSEAFNVDIDISCKNYKKIIPESRTVLTK